jgi:carbon monoxide dehydrogenase subunit G
METVRLEQTVSAPEATVRDLVTDVKPFMKAAGFDGVTVEGDEFGITNSVGLLTIELWLRLLDTDGVLAYEQVEGVFEEMVTRYTVEKAADGVVVAATTEFALDVDLVGSILDSTIIARQRRKELSAQFDYLEERAGTAGLDPNRA